MAGIYIHIPFCRSKCAYCDFYSTPRRELLDGYPGAVAGEWRLRSGELRGEPVATIYIGGGTPSLLPPAAMAALTASLPRAHVVELTVEANPEDITERWVGDMTELGVNRVSVGVQSLSDAELRAVGRRHSAATALGAIATLLRGGIANVSADLIYGLPGQDLTSWRSSLSRLLDSGISHLSAYALSYEPGTRLTAMLRKGAVAEAPQELYEQMYRELCAAAATAGFDHYEISNFALPGRQSRHNSSYWDLSTPYLGLGPGAHSFDGALRRVNPSDLRGYLAAYSPPQAAAPFYVVDRETPLDRANDAIITALRTRRGLRLDALAAAGAPADATERVMRNAAPHLASGRLVGGEGWLRIPEDHWLVADAIMRDLLLVDDGGR